MKENEKNVDALNTVITDLKQTVKQLERALARSRAIFLNIAGKSSDGIVIIDQKKMVIYANYMAMGIFDRSIADLLGNPLEIDFDQLMLSNKSSSEISIPQKSGDNIVTEATVFQTEWNN